MLTKKGLDKEQFFIFSDPISSFFAAATSGASPRSGFFRDGLERFVGWVSRSTAISLRIDLKIDLLLSEFIDCFSHLEANYGSSITNYRKVALLLHCSLSSHLRHLDLLFMHVHLRS